MVELALLVSGELDRERRDRYALRLLAVDGRASDSVDQRHTATASLNGALRTPLHFEVRRKVTAPAPLPPPARTRCAYVSLGLGIVSTPKEVRLL